MIEKIAKAIFVVLMDIFPTKNNIKRKDTYYINQRFDLRSK